MARGLLAALRRNPIRNTIFLTLSNAAIFYTYDYCITRQLMRAACKRAVKFGDKFLKQNDRPRHITVILNPIACKQKSKKLYSKWVEPLLHLAGIKVSLVETESPNQAFDLMHIMSNCDGVAIVGGDGTVSDAINGLLSRTDRERAVKEIPIAIIPAGQYNSIARHIYQDTLEYRNQKDFLVGTTLMLVDAVTQKYDVLKITSKTEQQEQQQHEQQDGLDTSAKKPTIQKTTYALKDLRYGMYQDSLFKLSGYYYYQTFVRPYWLRFKSMYSSSFVKPQIDDVSYTMPCIGCSKCYRKHKFSNPVALESVAGTESAGSKRSWWSGMLTPVNKQTPDQIAEQKRELELSRRDNPNCDQRIQVEDTAKLTELRASMIGDKKIRLYLGWRGEYCPSTSIDVQDVDMNVSKELQHQNELAVAEVQREVAEQSPEEQNNQSNNRAKELEKTSNFLIDGQPMEAHSVQITTLHDAVTIFNGSLNISRPRQVDLKTTSSK